MRGIEDIRSWRDQWNAARLPQIGALSLERQSPNPWTMLVVGLVAGVAIGGYAISQRAQLKRLGESLDSLSKGGIAKVSSARRTSRPTRAPKVS